MEPLSDEQLLAQYQSDSTSTAGVNSLDELFGRYHSRIATWCFRFTGDRNSAGDLAQDILLRAYRNLDSFRGASKFSTWLYTIARNHCLNEAKARSTRAHDAAEVLDFDLADRSTNSVLSQLEHDESVQAMRTLMEESLDDVERKVMVMHFGEDVTLESVSRLLGLNNPSGARAYVVSAKRKLASAVQRWNARQRGTR